MELTESMWKRYYIWCFNRN